ncbi:hypothetical protein HNR46_004275 [Haloferula luteola]|uniref:Uncharacterized protein n=1 Tax=Haloferula luteola TaxID=595692 RepID=A0A840V8E8_9BACT|nr:hypothetical protein [Haloferula luteola]
MTAVPTAHADSYHPGGPPTRPRSRVVHQRLVGHWFSFVSRRSSGFELPLLLGGSTTATSNRGRVVGRSRSLVIPRLIFGLPNLLRPAILANEGKILEISGSEIRSAQIELVRINGNCGQGYLGGILDPALSDKLRNPISSPSGVPILILLGASASHLTSAQRQRHGATPEQWRRSVPDLRDRIIKMET